MYKLTGEIIGEIMVKWNYRYISNKIRFFSQHGKKKKKKDEQF